MGYLKSFQSRRNLTKEKRFFKIRAAKNQIKSPRVYLLKTPYQINFLPQAALQNVPTVLDFRRGNTKSIPV